MTSKVELSEMQSVVLFCREQHLWDFRGDFDIVTRGRTKRVIEFKRHHVCLRCGADRTQVIDVPSFVVKKAKTIYPDGYLSSEGRLFNSDIRREQARRAGWSWDDPPKE